MIFVRIVPHTWTHFPSWLLLLPAIHNIIWIYTAKTSFIASIFHLLLSHQTCKLSFYAHRSITIFNGSGRMSLSSCQLSLFHTEYRVYAQWQPLLCASSVWWISHSHSHTNTIFWMVKREKSFTYSLALCQFFKLNKAGGWNLRVKRHFISTIFVKNSF